MLGLEAPCKILPNGVKLTITNVVDLPKTTWEEIVDDLKAVGTTVTKNSIGNTLRCDGQGPPVQQGTCTCLKFASEHLNNSDLGEYPVVKPKSSSPALT